ncbi:MAG TPA: hypothetical protein VLQ65_00455 [Saliniramus sp.]|nr:hypothetical protein [Saliniramus sp.]
MPRYHFNLVSSGDSIPDPQGADLPNVEAALKVALDVIAEVRMGKAPDGDWEGWRLEIVDASGAVIAGIPLSPYPADPELIKIRWGS